MLQFESFEIRFDRPASAGDDRASACQVLMASLSTALIGSVQFGFYSNFGRVLGPRSIREAIRVAKSVQSLLSFQIRPVSLPDSSGIRIQITRVQDGVW